MSGRRMFFWVALMMMGGLVAPRAWAGDKEPVELIQAQSEIPEELLLDVGILVFDPGLPDDEEELDKLENEGVFADVRKSETRYLPIQLKNTLQSTGFWGAVRVVPRAAALDVLVSGTILKSHGKKLEVEILVSDARGRKWFDDEYKFETNAGAYRKELLAVRDPYQSLYNEIANDILKSRQKLDEEDIEEIRTVTKLRFAADLAPAAFADYLAVDERKGRYEIEKLPSEDDPMMERLAAIRERDYMFIDTLNEYYADFYAQMDGPYDNWRSYSYEEQDALDKLRRQSRIEKILGIAAIAGGIYSGSRGGRTGRAAGEAAVMAGMMALQDGLQKSEEAKMHLEALRELASSLDGDITPLLIDVEGEITRLSGSAETQYATWRQLLRQIFATQTGLPVDPNAEPVGRQ